MIIPVITGATGMVGEGVLLECIENADVSKVYVVGRRSCGINHQKLTEIIHADLSDISQITEQMLDANACFFCAGVSSVGKSNEEYKKLTYDMTLGFAEGLAAVTRDLTFLYVSGQGTDADSRLEWAKIKAQTEDDLSNLGFKDFYAVRFGIVWPTKGQKNTLTAYKFIGWLKPVAAKLFPGRTNTLKEVGKAMIFAAGHGTNEKVFTPQIISKLASGKN